VSLLATSVGTCGIGRQGIVTHPFIGNFSVCIAEKSPTNVRGALRRPDVRIGERSFWQHGGVPLPRLVFVLSPYQNAFFGEITEALGAALRVRGVASVVVTDPDQHEIAADDVFVLLPPHEYVALEGAAFVDDPIVAARTIGISAEQPHAGFFDRNASLGARLGAVLDFSPLAVAAYRERGVQAEHLPFGYVPGWDLRNRVESGRRIEHEVLYLGNKQPRRLAELATAAGQLARTSAKLLISDNDEPNRVTSPTFVVGDDKRRLLSRTGLLINIHQSDEPYFEWLRFVEAVHCGTPVLTERSVESHPFEDSEHFLSFEPEALGPALEEALADPDKLHAVAGAAYEMLRSMPLAESVSALVDVATERLESKPPIKLPARTRSQPIGRDRIDPVPRSTDPRTGRRSRLRRAVGRRDKRWIVIAPPSTIFRQEPETLSEVIASSGFVNVMVDGIDRDGKATLEGIWPWQPWRLEHGQHLGRVLVVDTELHEAARRWLEESPSESLFESDPHLVVQLFAAVHGIPGGHVSRPMAEAHGWAIDPTHTISPALAERSRQMLRGSS
jgi:hypothetical protein